MSGKVLPFQSDGTATGEDIFLDEYGRVETVEYGLGSVATITYDGNSNPSSKIVVHPDGSGGKTTYHYDHLSRLRAVTDQDGLNLTYEYEKQEADLRVQLDQKMNEGLSTWSTGNHTFGSLEEMIGLRLDTIIHEYLRFDSSIGEFISESEGQDQTRIFMQMLTRFRVSDLEKLNTSEGKKEFEKALNMIFLPPEYSNANCCISFGGFCLVEVGDGVWEPRPTFDPACRACFPPPPPFVKVKSIDLPNDIIRVEVGPFGYQGTLTVQLLGGSNHTVQSAYRNAGTYDISFSANNIPTGSYSSVKATWSPAGGIQDTDAYVFRALGTYRHSQYNSPTESSCLLGTATYNVTDNQCTYTSGTFKTLFRNAVNLNGSGHSISFNDVAPEEFCLAPQFSPPAGASSNTFRKNHTITGTSGPVNNSTVAVNDSHPFLSQGNSVFILGVGVKTITDRCPGCSTAQLDNYTGITSCFGVTDLGNLKTFKLN